MNITLEVWKDAVMEHCKFVDDMIVDRKNLKNHFEEYLSEYFDWEYIEYDEYFNVIKLIWKENYPVISDNIVGLGIPFKMYFDRENFNIVIEVYPFGLPDEED